MYRRFLLPLLPCYPMLGRPPIGDVLPHDIRVFCKTYAASFAFELSRRRAAGQHVVSTTYCFRQRDAIIGRFSLLTGAVYGADGRYFATLFIAPEEISKTSCDNSAISLSFSRHFLRLIALFHGSIFTSTSRLIITPALRTPALQTKSLLLHRRR